MTLLVWFYYDSEEMITRDAQMKAGYMDLEINSPEYLIYSRRPSNLTPGAETHPHQDTFNVQQLGLAPVG